MCDKKTLPKLSFRNFYADMNSFFVKSCKKQIFIHLVARAYDAIDDIWGPAINKVF